MACEIIKALNGKNFEDNQKFMIDVVDVAKIGLQDPGWRRTVFPTDTCNKSRTRLYYGKNCCVSFCIAMLLTTLLLFSTGPGVVFWNPSSESRSI